MARTQVLKLKNRLKSEMQIMKTLAVLKQIAFSEFHFLDKQRKELSKYLKALETFFYFYSRWGFKESVFVSAPSKVSGILVVTSDEGFLGSLNAALIEKTIELYRGSEEAEVVVLGRRGAKKLADAGVPIREFPGLSFPLEYSAVLPVKAHLVGQFLKGQMGNLRVVYTRCHSFSRQTVEVEQLLPFDLLRLDAEAAGAAQEQEKAGGYIILEPAARPIIDYTIALWFGRRLYEVFWQSKLSELASRTIELTERHDMLSRRSVKTRLRYFRACHEVIDSGIREVFASLTFADRLKKDFEPAKAGEDDR